METDFPSLQEAVLALRDGTEARTRLEALDGVLVRPSAGSAVPAAGECHVLVSFRIES